jgi:hypothetical protein
MLEDLAAEGGPGIDKKKEGEEEDSDEADVVD